MSDVLKIALIQGPIVWHNADANRAYFEHKIKSVSEVNLFILPEMFTTGFTMNPYEVAEETQGETVNWMLKLAVECNCAITGSIVVKENARFYNRLIFVDENGRLHQYDKRHLFTLAGEQHSYSAGNDKLIIGYQGWKICPLVCYDLRFPVFSRNQDDYDSILYVANWPSSRVEAWKSLLKARSIENQAFLFGLNRIGTDGYKNDYEESSQVYFPDGKEISERENNVVLSEWNLEELTEFRTKFPFLDERDGFEINL